MRRRTDWILIISAVLFATTVTLFYAGITPYPFGCIALSLLIILRLVYLKGRGARR